MVCGRGMRTDRKGKGAGRRAWMKNQGEKRNEERKEGKTGGRKSRND